MEVTKDLVLESMNTYCTERKYGSENLTDGFKEKFSNFFVKKYDGKDVEEADVIADLHFNLDTAFSASVDINAALKNSFESKKTEYENQIAELNKKLGKKPEQKPFEIPKELQDKIDRLEAFENNAAKERKFTEIMELAKKDVRQDLHKSFEAFAKGHAVDLKKENKEQADSLVSQFQEIFKDSLGDIKPFAPRQVQQQEDDIIKGVKKVEL